MRKPDRFIGPVGLAVGLAIAGFALGCEGGPTRPSANAIVTFRVVNETFRVRLSTAAQVAAAEAAFSGNGPRLPVGRIVMGAEVNIGWSWHLEDVQFADAAIELCDGLPSHVERDGVSFAGGTFCPWGARIVTIERGRSAASPSGT